MSGKRITIGPDFPYEHLTAVLLQYQASTSFAAAGNYDNVGGTYRLDSLGH